MLIDDAIDSPELSVELLEEIKLKLEEDRQRKLDEIGKIVSKIRNEAVSARRESGIETQWREDEEYYQGIDDLNRSTEQYMKPRSDTGGLQSKQLNVSDNQCTEFPNITRPFVDAAEARMGDILLPANDWNFSIRATPVPEFDDHKDDNRPMIVDQSGKPFTVADAIDERNKKAAQITKKAETRIKDWLTQCGYKPEYRKVISGAVCVGTGVFKGATPSKQVVKRVSDGTLTITEEIVPVSKYISHWDAYPDMNCGENIQDGSYFIERAFLTARQLMALRGMQDHGYIDSAIDRVLREGPGKRNETSKTEKQTHGSDRFEVWYYYGDIKTEELKMLDSDYACECEEDSDDIGESVSAVIMMVNDTVIQGHKNPLENYGFPFDVLVWQRVAGQPFGIGVARQVRTAQKTVLASFRTLMENMGLASIPMMALLRGALEPADGDWTLRKGKQWIIREDSGVRNINEAIQTIVIPAMQNELQALIELGMKMAEDSTGITFLMQGQQGAAPDTVGGMQMMLQSSSTVLRRCARISDENVTIPHINRYYGWLLMYGEDDEKGDLMIEATGSSSLAEREIQALQLPQLLQYSMDARFELSPKKTLQELLRALKFDPGKFDMDDDEKAAQAKVQPAPDPRIQVEQIRTQKDLQIADKRAQVDVMKIQKDTDRDAMYTQGVSERNRMTYEAQIAELQLRRELAMLDYANTNKTNLDDIKAQLARDSMKLSVQKELASMDTTPTRQFITPPTEPIGRASTGRAYQE